MLHINTDAPDFTLLNQSSEPVSLSQFKNHWVLLYFYPKDDTPGCTQEACTIAEVYDEFAALGISVFGVSKDTPASHQKFIAKYSLPFTLLSDPEMEMMDTYGAKEMKQMYGKPVRGTRRMSYLISPQGKVVKVYEDVDPATHALELLSDIKAIQSSI